MLAQWGTRGAREGTHRACAYPTHPRQDPAGWKRGTRASLLPSPVQPCPTPPASRVPSWQPDVTTPEAQELERAGAPLRPGLGWGSDRGNGLPPGRTGQREGLQDRCPDRTLSPASVTRGGTGPEQTADGLDPQAAPHGSARCLDLGSVCPRQPHRPSDPRLLFQA